MEFSLIGDMQDDRKTCQLEELSARVESLESQIRDIQERNARVERDKAWEASVLRIVILVGLTYVVTSLVFWLIAVPRPLLNALIPTTAYYLSTLSLPIVQRWWIRRMS